MTKLLAANWKMNKSSVEASATITEMATLLKKKNLEDCEIVIFPPFTALEASALAIKKIPGASLGGQNFFPALEGAYTGEISPKMLKDGGATWVLTGHSERRHLCGESNALVGQKTSFALRQGLKVIMCVGETLEQRESGELSEILDRQLQQGLAGVPDALSQETLAIAYEPVWAIGTGKTAQNSDIVDAHAILRGILKESFGPIAINIRILYGGSVKPENAGSILGLDNVDGVLVGGASLRAEDFVKIINA